MTAERRKRPSPFSIRLSAEERAYLKRKAGRRPLGRYIRDKLLDGTEAPRKPSPAPPTEYVLFARLLGALGESEQLSCLFLLLAAAEAERVILAEKDRAALRSACADVREMRALLVKALGLKFGSAR